MSGTAPAKGLSPATVVIWAGISAALHVGKIPPAIPLLHLELGLSLMQSGLMLSMVQFAGMLLGLVVGLSADHWGLRKCMLMGLCLMFFPVASVVWPPTLALCSCSAVSQAWASCWWSRPHPAGSGKTWRLLS